MSFVFVSEPRRICRSFGGDRPACLRLNDECEPMAMWNETETVITRCPWATTPVLIAYHDKEWGRPVHDAPMLFELLTLEGAQAGLSWETVLRKRERYRQVFQGFDPQRVARTTQARVERILTDPQIIRNRAKIESTITNARAVTKIAGEFGSFDSYLWPFVDGRPIINNWYSATQVPARTRVSEALSQDLKARGFRFVGPTIVYAFMQAVGMVNDHLLSCVSHPGQSPNQTSK